MVGFIIFVSSLFLPVNIFSQEQSVPSTIPELLRSPLRGEAPRYPRDMVIGELGQGTAPEAAWRYAQGVAAYLVGAISGISGGDRDILREHFPLMESFEPRSYHIGGGRTEVDGSVSFLVRFLGREQWIAGELYLHLEEDNWRLDEIVLEELRTMEEGRGDYTYDFSPYERFF